MSLTLLHVWPHDYQLSHELNYYKHKVLMYLFLKLEAFSNKQLKCLLHD